MSEAVGKEKADDVMRRKCRAMVKKAKAYGWSGPPFDPKLLAGIFHIKVEETEEDFEGEGRIFPRAGRLVIQYRKGGIDERVRFTICHELAHTCFPDCYDVVRHQDGPADADEEAHKRFENLCDVGAAELLLPHDEFVGDMKQVSLDLGSAIDLAARYVASLEATLRRFLDLSMDGCCAAAFIGDDPVGRTQVSYCVKAGGFNGYVPKGTPVPQNSIARFAPSNGRSGLTLSRETWWIRGKPRSYYVEAHQLPRVLVNPKYPKAVALLHSRKPRG